LGSWLLLGSSRYPLQFKKKNVFMGVVETVRTVKNILDHWRIESIILFLSVDLEKPMIASIAHVRDVIGML
jgi:hypothetical protein